MLISYVPTETEKEKKARTFNKCISTAKKLNGRIKHFKFYFESQSFNKTEKELILKDLLKDL